MRRGIVKVTLALMTATLSYAMQLAEKGTEAPREDQGVAKEAKTHQGALICKPMAEPLVLMPQFKEFFAF